MRTGQKHVDGLKAVCISLVERAFLLGEAHICWGNALGFHQGVACCGDFSGGCVKVVAEFFGLGEFGVELSSDRRNCDADGRFSDDDLGTVIERELIEVGS